MRSMLGFSEVSRAIIDLSRAVNRRNRVRNSVGYASSHECLGLLIEELQETVECIHKNDLQGVRRELLDVAIVCIVGVASIDNGLSE